MVYILSLLLLILLAFSKAYFIVFLPVYLYIALKAFIKKNKKLFIFYLFSVIALLIQFFFIIKNRAVFIRDENIFLNVIDLIKKILYFYFYSFPNLIVGRFLPDKYLLLFALLIFGVIAFVIRKLYKENKNEVLKLFALSNFLALLSIGLTTLVNHRVPIAFSVPAKFLDDSHFFFSFVFLFFGISILFLNSTKKIYIQFIIILFIFINSNVFGFVNAKDLYPTNKDSFSQWKIFSKYLNNESYCIPINPSGWHTCRNQALLSLKVLGLELETKSSQLDINKLYDSDIYINSIELRNNYKDFKLNVYIYDELDNLLIQSASVLDPDYALQDFYFDKEIKNPKKIVFLDEKDGQAVPIDFRDIQIFGKIE